MPILLSLLAAALMGVAAVAQATAARKVSGPTVVFHPWYLLGGALDMIGWVLSLVAMRSLPLFVVQTILASSLAITVVVARIWLGVALSPRGWVTVIVLTGAVGVISAAGQPGRAESPPAGFTGALAIGLVVLLVACVLARHSGVAPQAILAGVGYSGTAIAARASESDHVADLATDPRTWLLVAYGVCGTLMFARSLQASRAAVAPATAWLWLVEVLVPSVVGLVWLGDRIRPGWSVVAAIALLVALASAAALFKAAAAVEA